MASIPVRYWFWLEVDSFVLCFLPHQLNLLFPSDEEEPKSVQTPVTFIPGTVSGAGQQDPLHTQKACLRLFCLWPGLRCPFLCAPRWL